MDRQTAKQMVPDAYDPCRCGSDKKFKFCCKPIFREVLGAMAASQDGQLDEALRYINFSDIDLLIDDSTSTQDIHLF